MAGNGAIHFSAGCACLPLLLRESDRLQICRDYASPPLLRPMFIRVVRDPATLDQIVSRVFIECFNLQVVREWYVFFGKPPLLLAGNS
ncbi:hypothetical protein Ppro_1305 [Pelobacter propionicus DSM 2379]|uniref:Uncharacterized protein n=1 Tax=Pelobacter propionicus (strain DSM 2379 / NBRC 103807 / OttBd1) TaxID=338966 RepID=A1ANK5_PELPD|nr:hypothetical protein Ppro_1305 [Pelobacter propionicus DSM 2379]